MVPCSKANSQKHGFLLSDRLGFESCLYHQPAVWPWARPSWLRASGFSSVKRVEQILPQKVGVNSKIK